MAFDHSHSGISMSFLEFDAKIKHFILNIVWQVNRREWKQEQFFSFFCSYCSSINTN